MPKSPRTRTTAGSIYAIGAADSPYIKIGSTHTSVEQRLRTLQTGQPAMLRNYQLTPETAQLAWEW